MDFDERQLRQFIQRYSFRNRLDAFQPDAPIFVRGRDSVVWDIHGKEYLDFNAGQMCAALGHNHPRIVEAIKRACDTQIHGSSTFYSVAEILLSARLAQLSTDDLQKSFFLSSGSDANEAAMVAARVFTGGTGILSPHISFHGLSQTPRSVTFAGGWRGHLVPGHGGSHAMFAPYCYRCPLGRTYPECNLACVDASFEIFDAECTGSPAAVITEPLFSAGGVVEPPPGWLARVQQKCRERNMLLILDEAQTGLAKLGTFYSFTQQPEVSPDLVTLSKHFGGGVEISAVLARDEVEDRVVAEGFVHSHSHTSDPLGCWAALASLDLIAEDDLGERALQIGSRWRQHLLDLQAEFEVIGDVRGRGLIQGVEFVADRETREPLALGGALSRRCLERGLIFSSRRGGTVIRFVPPFTTTDAQLDRAADILHASLREIVHG